jgi:hypothetical protein
MAKWLITWINNGKYEGKEIFPHLIEMMRSQFKWPWAVALPVPKIPDVHIIGYGFGWMISSYRGHYRVEHGGGYRWILLQPPVFSK